LRLLPEGGRFLELGKTDLRAPDQHPGVAYQAVDVLGEGPEGIARMLAALDPLFEGGALRPLPVTALDVRQAGEAFRRFGAPGRVGKVVLTMPRPLDPHGTVLVTGGTGGAGAPVAPAPGARH